ncbi:MAG: helix-turn-helix domain-containing protein [Thermoplasmata archaeon]
MSTTKDVRVFRRVQMILLHDRGETAKGIGEIVGCHPYTVSRWIHRFLEGGPHTLKDKPRSGRPPKATPQYLNLLLHEVRKSPMICGYQRTTWTSDILSEHMKRLTGIELKRDRILQLLRKHGIRFRRPKLHLVSPDPEYEKKRDV